MKTLIRPLLVFVTLLASTLYLTAGDNVSESSYSKPLTIVHGAQGVYVVGMFESFGAGSITAACAQQLRVANGGVDIDQTLLKTKPLTSSCVVPHCYSGDNIFGECATYKKQYMTDCGQGCVSYVCTDNDRNTCCNECTRGDVACDGCKTEGYCTAK